MARLTLCTVSRSIILWRIGSGPLQQSVKWWRWNCVLSLALVFSERQYEEVAPRVRAARRAAIGLGPRSSWVSIQAQCSMRCTTEGTWP